MIESYHMKPEKANIFCTATSHFHYGHGQPEG